MTPEGRAATMRHGFFLGARMTSDANNRLARPRLGDTAQARAAEREARQAAALRANLKRRKEQKRARQEEAARDPGASAAKDAEGSP